ncbi:MAG: TlpA family protein disulfide reductase [Burkholderiales bacterium]
MSATLTPSPRAIWRTPLRETGAMLCLVLASLLFAASASAFDLKDTTGKPQRLKDMKGKWVVVNFWATWCAPCIKEIPEIAEFAREQAAKANVIGIAIDWDETGKAAEDAAKLKRTAQRFGHKYPLVLSDDSTEKVFGKIKGMPTTHVFGPDGKLAWSKTGVVTKELLTRVINGEKP